MKSITNSFVSYLFRNPAYFFLLSLFLLNSCENPDEQNFSTYHTDDRFDYLHSIDTATVWLQTVLEDSIRSDEFTRDVVGFYNDPSFGKTKASLYFQIRLPKSDVAFGTNPEIDSVVLNLKYYGEDAYFGWLSSGMHLKIHEIDENIYLDSSYYSTSQIKIKANTLGEYIGVPKPTVKGALSIPLDNSIGEKILAASKVQLEDDDDFVAYLKGLAIIAQEVNGYGSMIYLDMVNDTSNLTIYYHNASGNSKAVFQVTNKCPRIGHFEHNFAGTPLAEQLAVPGIQYESVYLKALAGVKVKVHLPSLKNFVKDEIMVVNQAALVIRMDNKIPYLTNMPRFLLLLKNDSVNSNYALPDRTESYFNGIYDAVNMEYRFVITRYIQDLLIKYYENPDYTEEYSLNLIIPSDNPLIADPLLLKNMDINGNPKSILRLSVTKF